MWLLLKGKLQSARRKLQDAALLLDQGIALLEARKALQS
jgi:hypothetical protein